MIEEKITYTRRWVVTGAGGTKSFPSMNGALDYIVQRLDVSPLEPMKIVAQDVMDRV